MASQIKKASTKNKLVKKWDERRSYGEYSKALGRNEKGRGIYVLYRERMPYYVGRSESSLRSRIRRHATKDRHKGKWDNVSYYQILRTKYIKDVESLLLRYHKPEGNTIRGKFYKRYKNKN